MRAVIDTCVIIDFATTRNLVLANDANHVLASSYLKRFEGFITSNAVTDIYYLIHHVLHERTESLNSLNTLLDYISILDVSNEDCRRAIKSEVSDYEDAVLVESAIRHKADYIITDNIRVFKNSPIPAITASDFISKIIKESSSN